MRKQRLPIVALLLGFLCIVFLVLMPNQRSVATSVNETPPMLVSIKQIAYDTIYITFDKACDLTSATKCGNYWMQDTSNVNPTGIASLGQDERITKENSLSADQVTITPVDKSNTVFSLKFNDKIPSGAKYRLIICSITTPNAQIYNGDNGKQVFTGL